MLAIFRVPKQPDEYYGTSMLEISHLRNTRLRKALRRIAMTIAAHVRPVRNKDRVLVPRASSLADAVRLSGLLDVGTLIGIVVANEDADVRRLLKARRVREERKEREAALKVRSAGTLLERVEFDVMSMFARRNGLGPATDANALRLRVPREVRTSAKTRARQMHRACRLAALRALLAHVRDHECTHIVERPRELLRDEMDRMICGMAYDREPEGDIPIAPFVPSVWIEYECEEISRVRSEYARRLAAVDISAVVPLQIDDVRAQIALERAPQWMVTEQYKDASLMRLDAMLQEAIERKNRMAAGSIEEHAQSVAAVGRALEIEWDTNVEERLSEQLSDPGIKQAEQRIFEEANALAQAREEHRVACARVAYLNAFAADAGRVPMPREPTVWANRAYERMKLVDSSATEERWPWSDDEKTRAASVAALLQRAREAVHDSVAAETRLSNQDAAFEAVMLSDLPRIYCHRAVTRSLRAMLAEEGEHDNLPEVDKLAEDIRYRFGLAVYATQMAVT